MRLFGRRFPKHRLTHADDRALDALRDGAIFRARGSDPRDLPWIVLDARALHHPPSASPPEMVVFYPEGSPGSLQVSSRADFIDTFEPAPRATSTGGR